MTTTEKLREALQAIEPGWQAADAEVLRKRARRVRRKRRIAGAVVVAAAVSVAVGAAPHVFPHAGDGAATASFGGLPDTVGEAMAVADVESREGMPPVVTEPGKTVAAAFVPFVSFRLMPSGDGIGRVCDSQDLRDCTLIRRSEEGWATEGAVTTLTSESPSLAAAYWVAEAPVARVFATVEGQPAPTSIADLGQGYMLVSVRLPVIRERQGVVVSSTPDAIMAFDPSGRLVARHRE